MPAVSVSGGIRQQRVARGILTAWPTVGSKAARTLLRPTLFSRAAHVLVEEWFNKARRLPARTLHKVVRRRLQTRRPTPTARWSL